MTKQQLLKLKPNEFIKHIWTRYIEGKISYEQYDRLLKWYSNSWDKRLI